MSRNLYVHSEHNMAYSRNFHILKATKREQYSSSMYSCKQ